MINGKQRRGPPASFLLSGGGGERHSTNKQSINQPDSELRTGTAQNVTLHPPGYWGRIAGGTETDTTKERR